MYTKEQIKEWKEKAQKWEEREAYYREGNSEAAIVNAVNQLCITSLPPDTFAMWETVVRCLYKTRSKLKGQQLPEAISPANKVDNILVNRLPPWFRTWREILQEFIRHVQHPVVLTFGYSDREEVYQIDRPYAILKAFREQLIEAKTAISRSAGPSGHQIHFFTQVVNDIDELIKATPELEAGTK